MFVGCNNGVYLFPETDTAIVLLSNAVALNDGPGWIATYHAGLVQRSSEGRFRPSSERHCRHRTQRNTHGRKPNSRKSVQRSSFQVSSRK
jgi:hypothetical protein